MGAPRLSKLSNMIVRIIGKSVIVHGEICCDKDAILCRGFANPRRAAAALLPLDWQIQRKSIGIYLTMQ